MTWFVPKVYEGDGANDQRAVAPRAVFGQGLGGDFQPGALESSLHWQVIWPRVIAKAWQDADFRAEVIADPSGAIANHFGYELSPNLELTITEAPADATFEPEDLSPDTDNDPWSKLPKLRLTIVIPPAPDAALQAVAITAYQDTGRTYPFTCC